MNTVEQPKVVSRKEWIAERKQLLREEKALTRMRDRVSAKRRELPWVKVGKEYLFDTPRGKRTLADLFDGRSQLIVQHFMFAPGWGASAARSRRRGDPRHLHAARPDAEGAQRKRPQFQSHRLGASS